VRHERKVAEVGEIVLASERTEMCVCSCDLEWGSVVAAWALWLLRGAIL
jgi:hypothetical protein